MKIRIITFLLPIVLLSVYCRCSDSDSPKDLTLEESIWLENAELVEAEMPSPSADIDVLGLDNTYNNIELNVRPGGSIVIGALLNSGSAAGFLVSVEGISGHFVIASSQASTARVQENNYASFRLGFANRTKTGTFKIQFSVYDEAGLISNKISQTIHVSAESDGIFEGVERWTATQYKYYAEDVVVRDTSISDPINWDAYIQFYCIDQEEMLFLSYIRYTRTEVNLNLMSGNSFIEENLYTSHGIDHEATTSSCSVVMEQDTVTEGNMSSGIWSYNQTTKELTMTYTYSYGTEIEPYTVMYNAILENKTLVLSTFLGKNEEDKDMFGKTVYIPRN